MDMPEPRPTRLGRTYVLINSKAGSALDEDSGSLENYIQEQLGGDSSFLLVETVPPSKIVDHLQLAAKEGYDTFIVAGGDGSVCAAANQVMGTDITLAVIPLGTANLMARDLGVPVTYREAIDALLNAEPRPVDVAEVNGRVFLCSSLLGVPSDLPEERQRLRGGTIWRRIAGYSSMAWTIWRGRRGFRVRIDYGDGPKTMRIQMAIISNNPYDDSGLLSLKRSSLSTGRLGLYILKHQSLLAAFWTLFRTFLGRAPRDPDFERHSPREVRIEAITRSKFELSNDGEIEEFASPLVFKIRPKALKMLVPF
jgi:diacylglycerol kinase family enzyme